MTQIVEGIYKEVVKSNIGTGGTAQKQEIENFYSVKMISDDLIQVQLLDMNDELLPIMEKVDLAEFKRRFIHQPDYFKKRKTTTEKQVDKNIAQAEKHIQRKEYNSAEWEYNKALKLDEKNVRANFGKGKVYMATGEYNKAKETFERLARIDAVLEVENKHIFNELGIELRRLKLYDEAVAHYQRALSITEDDEHLFYNAALASYLKGDQETAGQYVDRALAIKPDFEQALKLARRIGAAG